MNEYELICMNIMRRTNIKDNDFPDPKLAIKHHEQIAQDFLSKLKHGDNINYKKFEIICRMTVLIAKIRGEHNSTNWEDYEKAKATYEQYETNVQFIKDKKRIAVCPNCGTLKDLHYSNKIKFVKKYDINYRSKFYCEACQNWVDVIYSHYFKEDE